MPSHFAENEEVLYVAHMAWWPFVPTFALGGVLAMGALIALSFGINMFTELMAGGGLVGVLMIVGAVLRKRSATTRVTQHHVVRTRDLLSLHTTTLNLNRIESVDLDQNVFQRMLGYGNVTIRGVGTEDLVLNGLRHPEVFKSAVMSVVDQTPL